MAELREVFEMVTKQAEPDRDSWKQQEERQRRIARNRRVGAIALVAAVIAALVVVFAASRPEQGPKVAHSPSAPIVVPFDTTPPVGPQIVGIDGHPMLQLPGTFGFAESLAMSPDGSTVAFVVAGEIHVMGTDGTNDLALTEGTNVNNGDAMGHVSWSPDGSTIAYAWSGEIYVMNADGSDKRRLTQSDPGTGSYYPVFSPDGSSIAFWRGSNTGEDGGPSDAEIYTISALGGTPTRLTRNDHSDIEPTWSPNGSRIAYWTGGHLGVMHADGSGMHEVYADPKDGGAWAPAWSPDGGRIAFLVYRGSRSAYDAPLLEVRVLTVATGEVSRLSVRVVTDLNGPQWVSDDALLINRYD
jgi:Tol biopolymer transport system component